MDHDRVAKFISAFASHFWTGVTLRSWKLIASPPDESVEGLGRIGRSHALLRIATRKLYGSTVPLQRRLEKFGWGRRPVSYISWREDTSFR
jgi:hypothetical protein